MYQVRYGAGMAASPEDAGRDVAAAATPATPATPALPAGISAATVTVATVSVTTPPLRT